MKRSKNWAILLLVAGLATIAPLSCAKAGATPTATSGQVVTVQPGQLLVQIPTSGNLAFSQTADLAFQGTGTIDQINVQLGDSVKKGEVVAALDQSASSSWQANLTKLQQALTSAQRSELPAESNLSRDSLALQQALNNSQVTNSPTLQVNASQVTNLQNALTAYNNALAYLQSLTANFQEMQSVIPNAQTLVDIAQSQVNASLTTLTMVLANADSTALANARLTVAVDQKSVDDAKNAVVTAQQALDAANAASPQLVAPFDGIVTAIGTIRDPKTGQTRTMTGGDVVNTGTIGVSIADPTQFEADVLVNEADIYNVNIGSTATVQAIAAPTISYPGTVTAVAPTATVTSGVVNYKVTVAVANQPTTLSSVGSQSVTPSPTSSLQLKSGLTVTVNILVQTIPDALLVPNRAITRQGTQNVVKVLKADGTTETRVITVGPNTITSTQVLSGLSAGDKVVVP